MERSEAVPVETECFSYSDFFPCSGQRRDASEGVIHFFVCIRELDTNAVTAQGINLLHTQCKGSHWERKARH